MSGEFEEKDKAIQHLRDNADIILFSTGAAQGINLINLARNESVTEASGLLATAAFLIMHDANFRNALKDFFMKESEKIAVFANWELGDPTGKIH